MSRGGRADTAAPQLPAVSLAMLGTRQVDVPGLVHVRRTADAPAPGLDVAATVEAELRGLLPAVRRGHSVAVAVGSRGIARIGEVVEAVVRVLRAAGADPFLVPAMGSHGGASEEGQRAVLAGLGITDRIAPVRASMDTVSLGTVDDVEVHVSTEALTADHVLLVNRVKSHTSFSGRIESGLAKMAVIGLGKRRGAEELHRLPPTQLERRLLAAYSLLRTRLPLLGGLAVVESRDKRLRGLHLLRPEEIGGEREAELLVEARRHEARLPFDEIDVLVVDRMGKEISGTGMDTNVLGRRMVRGSAEPPGPVVTNVVVLEVTPGSEGNAVGLGLADFVPVSILGRVDLVATYANALTAGLQGVQRAQIPIALATERDAVTAAVMTAGLARPEDARIVRIRSTLALDELLVTPNLLGPDSGVEPVEPLATARDPFDGEHLSGWPVAAGDGQATVAVQDSRP